MILGGNMILGGKGTNLRRLSEAGLVVPRWSAVGLDALSGFRARTGLDGEIADLLAGLSPETADDIAERIAKAFAATPLDAPALEAVGAAYAEVGGLVAVRSSGAGEDLPNLSFAGRYSSYLGIEGVEEVAEHVKLCWASAYSARSLVYRRLHDLPVDRIEMAVVLQRIVPAEVSGVLFTVNPVSGDRNQALISCVYGLGETLVSGAVDADTLSLDRVTGIVGDAVIGEKAERLDCGSGLTEVPPHDRERFALTNDQVVELGALAAAVEALFGCPQDVEWALHKGVFHVLQSRPVTTLTETPADPPAWDDPAVIEPAVIEPFETVLGTGGRVCPTFLDWSRVLWTSCPVRGIADDLHEAYAEFDAVDYEDMPGEEVNRELYRLEERLRSKRAGAAVLDNVVMLSCGILYGLTSRWLPGAPEGFLFQAVGEGDDAEPGRHDADAYLEEHLGGLKLFVYDRVRGKVGQVLRERERVGSARTRVSGTARRMLTAIGGDLERAGALGDRGDVFLLELEEIRAAYAGTLDHRELRPLSDLRRRQRTGRRLRPAPRAGAHRRPPAYGPPQAAPGGEEVLRGTPCGSGVVTAPARIVDTPHEASGGVLVAYRTDPGWAGALPSAAALLVERGSPLTHVAIVARELGVPAVVQIPCLTARVRDGMSLTVDGGTGTVTIGASR
ncbi:PEP/pyruvate-binding domain-containing protein [Actinocorallia longicatena]|uniref:Pyruvate,water dikinase n=1 Tax=Actinocorallia longicatena TaxID=111803 RepID=A0ABP6QAE3_9ACTN